MPEDLHDLRLWRLVTNEERLLFALTRQDFSDVHKSIALDLLKRKPEWAHLYFTASIHGVAPLVYRNLKSLSPHGVRVDEEIDQAFKRAVMRNMFLMQQARQAVKDILSIARSAGFDVMLIKGAAYEALIYDEGWYITSADRDIVLRPAHGVITRETIQRLFNPDGPVPLEIDSKAHHDIDLCELAVDFEMIWNDARAIPIENERVFVMSTEDMLIAACINSYRKRYFMLRELFAISEIVRQCREMRWNVIARKARAYRCAAVVYAALVAAKMCLGCTVSKDVLSALDLAEHRSAIIRALARSMSFSSLRSLNTGIPIGLSVINTSLLLPYYSIGIRAALRRAQAAMRNCRSAVL